MTLHNLHWTLTPKTVTLNTHYHVLLGPVRTDIFFSCHHSQHWVSLLPPALLSTLLQGFLCSPCSSHSISLHRCSILNQWMVMVRDLDTTSQTSAVSGTGPGVGTGNEMGQRDELSVLIAVMYMGYSDLRLFLSLDMSAPCISASAPPLPSVSPCWCVWVTALTWDGREEPWGCYQGDLLSAQGTEWIVQPSPFPKALSSCS